MRQQINLYQPKLIGERKRFSAGSLAAVLALVIAALAAYSMQTRKGLTALEDQVATLQTQKTELDSMSAQSAQTSSRPEDLESKVKELVRAIAERKRALEMLQSGAAGQTNGFAARLEALARRHVEGLWIDSVMLSGTTGAMNLSGATLNADIVPTYLHSLAQDPVLNGTRFDDFVIERPAAAKPVESDADAAEEPAASRQAATKYVRFRAGTRALAAIEEPAT